MAFDFTGKRILITGAGRGIGRETAKTVANAGGEVYALGRTKQTLESLAEEVSNIHPVIVDLSDWAATKTALDELEVFDGVVNNAAVVHPYVESLKAEKDMLDETWNTNVLAPINVIQTCAKKMIAAGKPGSIVNISSIAGVRPFKHFMDYTISKAGLDMVTKQFALELGPHQIRVNSVNPAWVWTEGIKEVMATYPDMEKKGKSLIPMGRFCELHEVVEPIMYLLSDHSSMVNGTVQVVDGGLLSNIPL